jgi:thiol-disulfide isomerase/thioredoxin
MAVWRWIGYLFIFLVSGTISAQSYSPALAQRFSSLNGVAFAPIELEDCKGDTFNTASLTGKTLYIDFWFTQCAPCIRQIPYAEALQRSLSTDTNLVFVSICIENIERKEAWKKMVAEKSMHGIQLFYARNRPQKINLLRRYKVNDFPTYLLVDANQQVTGYDAPAPSEQPWVNWALHKASQRVSLADAYRQMFTPAFTQFIKRQRLQAGSDSHPR